ncbi:MAG: hypothetical protein QNI84_07455 [Henriciella sp.]|nr:hypothetical protein [Henriciella sp.]
MSFRTKICLCGMAVVPWLQFSAKAQSTAGVFGPVVNEDDRGWEYRGAYDGESEEYNQRLHYQQAINGDLRWRVVAQVRETDDSDFDPDYLRGELVWQVTPDAQKFQSGFRFEGRYRFDDRPGDVTVHWTNQWKHIDNWTLRFIVGVTQQISNDPEDGLLIQTRAGAYTSLENGPRLGVELYSEYGSTSDWLPVDEQEHTAGPFAVWKLSEDWSLYTGALFGITDVSPETNLRIRLTHAF